MAAPKSLPKTYSPHLSSLGGRSAAWVAAGLYILCFIFSSGHFWGISFAYIVWILALVIFFAEKYSGLVRFHAMQAAVMYFCFALLIFAADQIGGGVQGLYPLVRMPNLKRALVNLFMRLPAYVLVGWGSYKAARAALAYSEYDLPLLGQLSRRLAEKLRRH